MSCRMATNRSSKTVVEPQTKALSALEEKAPKLSSVVHFGAHHEEATNGSSKTATEQQQTKVPKEQEPKFPRLSSVVHFGTHHDEATCLLCDK
eukprot:g6397.t1